MDTEEAWQQFRKSGTDETGIAKSVTDDNNTQNLRTMLETILANQHEIMTNTQRTADLVPRILGDEGAINAANDQAGIMAAMGGGMPPGGAPPEGGAPPGAEGGMPPMGGAPPAEDQGGGGDMSEDEINQILASLGGESPEGGAPAPGGMPPEAGGAPEGGAPMPGGEGGMPPMGGEGAPDMGAPEGGAPEGGEPDSMESIKNAIKKEIQQAMDEGNFKAAKELVDALESIESYEEESTEGLEGMGGEGAGEGAPEDLGFAGGLGGAGGGPVAASANKGVTMSNNGIRKNDTGAMPAEGGAETAPATDAGTGDAGTAPVAACNGGSVKDAVTEKNSELSKKGQGSVGKTTAGQRRSNAEAGMKAAKRMISPQNLSADSTKNLNKRINNARELYRRAENGVYNNADGAHWENDREDEVKNQKDDTDAEKEKTKNAATIGNLKAARKEMDDNRKFVMVSHRKTNVNKSALPSFRDMVDFHKNNPNYNVYDRGIQIRKAMDGEEELPPVDDEDVPVDDVPVDDAPVEGMPEDVPMEAGPEEDILQKIADYCQANGITEEQLAAMSDEEIAEIVKAALGDEEVAEDEAEIAGDEAELANDEAEINADEAELEGDEDELIEDTAGIGKSEEGIQSADCACKGMNGSNSLDKDALASASVVHKEVNKKDMGTSHSVDGILQSGGALDKNAIASAKPANIPPAQTGLTINKSGGKEIMSMKQFIDIRKSSSFKPDFRCSTNGDISRPELTRVSKTVGNDSSFKIGKNLEGFKKSAQKDMEEYKAYKQAQREKMI